MAIVERGNRVCEVRDSEVQAYLDLGYNVTDGNGTVLQESIPNDIGTLRKAYTEHKAKIQKLEEELVKVQEQLAEAKKKSTTSKKVVSEKVDK